MPGIFALIFLMPLYFPSGKLISPLWKIPVVVILVNLTLDAIGVILRPWPWPGFGIFDTRMLNGISGIEPFFDQLWNHFLIISIPALLFSILAPIIRYRRTNGIERTQMKWAIAAIVAMPMLGSLLLLPGVARFDVQSGYTFTWGIAMLLPIAIGVAILQYNLFDIDIIINRSLVYGILTLLIVILYVATVSVLGLIVQAQTSVLSGIIVAGIVAVAFQPLRDRLQKIVNRILFGEWDEPEILFSRLAKQLETSGTPTSILPNLVQTIARTLKLPYVAIWAPSPEGRMEVIADFGKPPERRETIALVYQNEVVGQLDIAQRGRNERFTRDERRLLTTIAALAAITVQAVQLSDELQQSRQHIITAREEERRRIRRNLHDGLGHQLASQTLGLEAVAQLMLTNPDKARTLISSLQDQAQEAIQDMRRLVYDLRPPVLDELGLTGALEESALRYESNSLHFQLEIENSQPELPAAIETAILRIAQEAMTNAVRHSKATHCKVRLYYKDNDVTVEIEDDGRGLPENFVSGIGLQTMRERATELNGETIISSLARGGTRVQARLPL
jgi:signal transduction histidine kinase